MDTGSTYTNGPNFEIDLILAQVRASATCNNMPPPNAQCLCIDGDYSNFPTIIFYMDQNKIEISPKNYLYRHKHSCYVLFGYSNDFFWIFGQAIFRQYYSVFDADNKIVSLYTTKNKSSVYSMHIIFIIVIIAGSFLYYLLVNKNSAKVNINYTKVVYSH